jgi:hypothetical protein
MNAVLETGLATSDGVRRSPAPEGSEPANARLELIRRYQAEALTRPNALAGCVGVLNGDLMLLAHGLTRTVEKQLVRSGGPREIELTRASQTYLAIARQIDRFARLDLDLAAAGTPSAER